MVFNPPVPVYNPGLVIPPYDALATSTSTPTVSNQISAPPIEDLTIIRPKKWIQSSILGFGFGMSFTSQPYNNPPTLEARFGLGIGMSFLVTQETRFGLGIGLRTEFFAPIQAFFGLGIGMDNRAILRTPSTFGLGFGMSITRPVVTLINYTFSSDGDANGLFYDLGTNFGAVAWENPHTAGRMVVIAPTLALSDPEGLVDRATGITYTTSAPGSWIAFDVGANRSLRVNRYTIRHYIYPSEYLRSWQIQGSNNVASNDQAGVDAASWTTIDTKTNNTTINAADAWGSFAVAGQVTYYRWLRILLTGQDSSGTDYLVCAEAEFYGQFKEEILQ